MTEQLPAAERRISEYLARPTYREIREAEGFCGDAPADRLIGETASTKHDTCLGCFYPMPTTALIDGKCDDCRGEIRPERGPHNYPKNRG